MIVGSEFLRSAYQAVFFQVCTVLNYGILGILGRDDSVFRFFKSVLLSRCAPSRFIARAATNDFYGRGGEVKNLLIKLDISLSHSIHFFHYLFWVG